MRGSDPKAVVALELAVTDGHTGAVKVVRSYRAEVPAADATVKAAVVAANQAIANIFADFLRDLQG